MAATTAQTVDIDTELARLRLTVAKVRSVCRSLRERQAHYQAAEAIANHQVIARSYRIAADAIEDALIDADYETAALPEAG